MPKPKKLGKVHKRRRTSLEIEEEQTRTLYIRVPHTIKDAEEIKALFFGDLTVRIPRQSARHCHVIFPTIEEKIKNMKLIKKKLIDGKPIFAGPPRPVNLEKKKPKQKKIVIPEPKDDPKIGKYLLVSNIPPGVKGGEIKDAFPGSVTVALLKLHQGFRQAKVKMSSSQLCLNYLKNRSEWPTLRDKKVVVSLSKSPNKKRKKNKKSTVLKMYDGENDQKGVAKSNKSEDKKQLKKSKSTESDKEEDVESKEDEDEEEDEDDDDDESEEVENEDEEEDEDE